MKKNRLEIVRFINTHPNWKVILRKPPYSLLIREKGNYVLLKYIQGLSSFRKPMVCEARGLILKKVGRKYVPVCVPFNKFFNYGGAFSQESVRKLTHRSIWNITDKIDGSLIKAFYDDGEWHIATNGSIDAREVSLTFPSEKLKTFYDMFMAANNNRIEWDKLDKGYTYMFELVGKENACVVRYECDLYYLARKSNYYCAETPYKEDDCKGVEKLKRPPCLEIHLKSRKNNMLALKQYAKQILNNEDETGNFEGVVISDYGSQTRLKVKSRKYMELSQLKSGNNLRAKKILLMILEEQDDDFVAMFPEFKPRFDGVRHKLITWMGKIKKDIHYMCNQTWKDKMDFVEWAKTTTQPSIIFAGYGRDCESDEWLFEQVKKIYIKNIMKAIGLDDDE